MIFQKKCLQTIRPRTNSQDSKNLYSLSFTPRKTNYIFRKIKHPEQIQVNCLSNFRSIQEVETSPTYNRNKNDKKLQILNLQQPNQISCSSFMKSYIDKLKKQRKRQHRKLLNSRTNKQQVERANSGGRVPTANKQIYMAKQMNHIFVLQKIPKKSNLGFMNTISIVQQDLNHFSIKNSQLNETKVNQWAQPSWANKQKIQKLIKQMRDSRGGKIGDAQDLYSPEQQDKIQKNPQNYNLPALSQRSRQLRSRVKAKLNNRAAQLNFKTLEPWKQQSNNQEFSIQQYNEKN